MLIDSRLFHVTMNSELQSMVNEHKSSIETQQDTVTKAKRKKRTNDMINQINGDKNIDKIIESVLHG
jgi:hypothetical protein